MLEGERHAQVRGHGEHAVQQARTVDPGLLQGHRRAGCSEGQGAGGALPPTSHVPL